MTNAELGVKIIDIKLAILKIMSKSQPECKMQYLELKQNKEKTIVKIGMTIQKNKFIDEFINIMVLKSIINNDDIINEDKIKIINLSPNTFSEVLLSLDDKTKNNLKALNLI